MEDNRNRKASPDTSRESRQIRSISEIFDIPSAALSGVMQIQFSGNTEVVVEGCTGVLEYNENVIRLAGGKLSAKFSGRNLQLKLLTQDSAVIGGFVTSLEYIV